MKKTTIPVAVLILLSFALSACGGSQTHFAGSYQAIVPADNSPGQDFRLVLSEDAKAVLRTDNMNGEPPIVENGTWKQDGDFAIVYLPASVQAGHNVTLEITFELQDDRLVAVNLDHPEYESYAGLRLAKE